VFPERIAARAGLLQRIDPRVKVAALLGLLLAVAFLRSFYVLLGMYCLTLVLAAVSSIPLRFFVKRVWLFIPLFAGVIVIPSLFNVVRPGEAIWTIWDFGGEVTLGPWSLGTSLAVTRQGLEGAAMLVLRVATSVSLAVLLALTTHWADLLKALRVFFVPRIFILILSMTYRYIFLLLGLAGDMFVARTSRMVGPSSPREDRRFVAAGMGMLLGKSHTMSDEVYAAMVSRGYIGEPMSMHTFRTRGIDWLFLAAMAGLGALALGGDRFIG
jgi:cobalt/nickel transport system permease protein